MKTHILTSEEIDRAAVFLRADEIVAFPTETVYGLGARVFSPAALQKIFLAKNRPADNPLIVHISAYSQLTSVADKIPLEFYLLAEAFFPGPLTVILKRNNRVPALVSAGLDTIAIRMPKHPCAKALIERVGEPIAAPSANLSGKPSATLAAHVLEDFDGKIAAIIDGGSSEVGIESTVINLASSAPLLMRPGVITKQQIEAVLKREIEVCLHPGKGKVVSPGMKYRHYAPKAPILLFKSIDELRAYLTQASLQKRLLLARQKIEGLEGVSFYPLSVHELYASLRHSDREGCYAEILVLCDAAIQKDVALMNRLIHASAN